MIKAVLFCVKNAKKSGLLHNITGRIGFERVVKMKRHVFLTVLCLGVVSVLAMVVSIPEPVRMLSTAEKTKVIAGLCNRYDCDQWCTNAKFCYRKNSSFCIDHGPGAMCGQQSKNRREECSHEDTNMLDPVGTCQSPTTQTCYFRENCTCDSVNTCSHKATDYEFNVAWAFSHHPCTGMHPW